MTPSARYALAIALTNLPQGDDWNLIRRLTKMFTKRSKIKLSKKLKYLVYQNEVCNIPEILQLISIDDSEYNHLMTCLYKNGLAGSDERDSSNEEIHEKEEYWLLDSLETAGLERFCIG